MGRYKEHWKAILLIGIILSVPYVINEYYTICDGVARGVLHGLYSIGVVLVMQTVPVLFALIRDISYGVFFVLETCVGIVLIVQNMHWIEGVMLLEASTFLVSMIFILAEVHESICENRINLLYRRMDEAIESVQKMYEIRMDVEQEYNDLVDNYINLSSKIENKKIFYNPNKNLEHITGTKFMDWKQSYPYFMEEIYGIDGLLRGSEKIRYFENRVNFFIQRVQEKKEVTCSEIRCIEERVSVLEQAFENLKNTINTSEEVSEMPEIGSDVKALFRENSVLMRDEFYDKDKKLRKEFRKFIKKGNKKRK